MKIIICNEKNIELHTMEIEFTELIAQAESEIMPGGDPIQKASDLLIQKINSLGFKVHPSSIKEIPIKISLGLNKEEAVDLKVVAKDILGSNKRNSAIDVNSLGVSNLFELILSYPNDSMKIRYDALFGLDDTKGRLVKEAILILSKASLEGWSKKFHKGKILSVCKAFITRCPFIIFGGDVGTGKTELAETIGDPISKLLKKNVLLLRMSLETRGGGIVGEMTKLINKAFREAQEIAVRANCPIIFLLDEADTLAQSREAIQMHHEDRAGVNALIQGIDHIRMSKVPILIIFCTNRLKALDPAIKRRAAVIYKFIRPGKKEREDIFNEFFADLKLSSEQITQLVKMTGPTEGKTYGYTYSDLINRLIPNAILEAFPDKPLDFNCISQAFKITIPTEPFEEF
ncbi:MAG: ATP-binding protein [Candidatus Omnitrophota bacterium]|nr:ATP-binding protein [Candidatus Omnitrophota bacterium]